MEERNFKIYTSWLQNAKDESKKEQYNFYVNLFTIVKNIKLTHF